MDLKKLFTQPLPKNDVSHAALLAIAGGYVIYLAYTMIRDTLSGASDMSLTLTIILAGVMGLAGLAVFLYGARLWYRANKAQQEQAAQEPEAEEDQV